MAPNENNKILIHACCGICSGYPISLLREMGYEPVVYFCNPNLDTKEEYDKRLEAQKIVCMYHWVDLVIEEYNHEDFSKFQLAIVNLDSANFYKNTTKEENQILNAIYRLFVLQVDDDRTSFSVDPDEAFDLLIEKLNQNIPVVTIIYGNGNHAINATRLIQDNDDANLFYLEVYDNNFPGEKRYIEIHRSKMNKIQLSYTAWTNDYDFSFKYDQNNDGTLDDITVSLAEYQLE